MMCGDLGWPRTWTCEQKELERTVEPQEGKPWGQGAGCQPRGCVQPLVRVGSPGVAETVLQGPSGRGSRRTRLALEASSTPGSWRREGFFMPMALGQHRQLCQGSGASGGRRSRRRRAGRVFGVCPSSRKGRISARLLRLLCLSCGRHAQ